MKKHLIHYLFLIFFLLSYACKDDPEIIIPPKNNEEDKGTPQNPEKPSARTDSTTYIFDITVLPEVTLTVSTEEWNKLLSYFDQNPNNEEYVKGTFVFDKEGEKDTLNNIGLRIRGNTSRRRPEGVNGQMHNPKNPNWHHASFTVSFKKYNKDQRFCKTEKINLKWFKDDPMYVREVYCYDLFERFGVWTAPQSSYCKLNINIKEDNKTAFFGVYQLIEPVDESYLTNRASLFSNDTGNLWKGNYGASLRHADMGNMGVEDISLTHTYSPVYDLKTNKKQLEAAKKQLADFIVQMNLKKEDELKNWLLQKMDVDLFLKTYAVNVMCGMWDDYWVNSNNYYFYFNASGKFYFIPYDYDNTLGTSLIMNDSGTQDVYSWGNPSNPLVMKVLSIPEFKAKYTAYLHELNEPTKDLFYYTKSISRIRNWQNMIRNYISNDTGEDMELADRPANWGNCPQYRLLSDYNNFFKIKGYSLP